MPKIQFTMEKIKSIIWKLLKWGIIAGVSYWLFTVIVFGEGKYDGKKGIIIRKWSGLEALFTEEEFGYFENKRIETKLDGIDGPYLFQDSSYTVDEHNHIHAKKIDRTLPFLVQVGNADADRFTVSLRDSIPLAPQVYALPQKLIAISDIEGNFNAFYSFLISNKVMDAQYNWTFGKGHLVLNGDFVDRGKQVTAVLWLIYMLEEKAEKQGGKVHFIIGNHEVMNLAGQAHYVDNKYIEVAKQLSQKEDWDEAYLYLYNRHTVLGKWLRSKNVMEKIGNYLFVHAGLSTKLVEEELTIDQVNKIAQKYYGQQLTEKPENEQEYVVLSSIYSPYWYRGLALAFKYKLYFLFTRPFGTRPTEAEQADVDQVLNYYQVQKVIIGHTVVDDITTAYNGKVIKIDLKHGKKKYSPHTKGVLIEGDKLYKVDGLGKREAL